jgi:hypothetical protein
MVCAGLFLASMMSIAQLRNLASNHPQQQIQQAELKQSISFLFLE